jgi:hypothetical protein
VIQISSRPCPFLITLIVPSSSLVYSTMSQRRKKERDADAEDEEERQYAMGGQTLEELDEK